jgi:hypothetical protein
MKTLGKDLLSLVLSLVAILLGYVAVWLVNLAGGWLLDALLPGSRTPGGIPLTTAAQIADLFVLFAAGLAGGFVVVLAAPRAPGIHALSFGAIALAIDLWVVLGTLQGAPLWYRVLVIATVPPQIWVGAKLGMMARHRIRKR